MGVHDGEARVDAAGLGTGVVGISRVAHESTAVLMVVYTVLC